MSSFEEETYSTIFTSLKHPVRRKILRMLSEKPRSFSEILEALGISSSHLTYHLENLGELVSKMDDGKYKLSTFGEAAVGTMSRVEEIPKATERKRPSPLPMEWRSFFVGLMIGLVVLAGVSYAQHQSLNRMSAKYDQLSNRMIADEQLLNKISAEYKQLKELVDLVEKGAELRYEYCLEYEYASEVFEKSDSGIGLAVVGPLCCVIYSPYDNFTLDLILLIGTIPSESQLPISVQEGNVFELEINEIAPVIWSVNATVSNAYSVPLASKGWYTISLFRPVTETYPFTIISESVSCWALLRIICEGKFSPFIVLPEPY